MTSLQLSALGDAANDDAAYDNGWADDDENNKRDARVGDSARDGARGEDASRNRRRSASG